MILIVRIALSAMIALTAIGCSPRVPPADVSPKPSQDFALEIGREAHLKGDYAQAIRTFQQIIADYPGSPLLHEAQWMLAQSYEAQGNLGAAIDELRSFVLNFPASRYQHEARGRITALEALYQGRLGSVRLVGIEATLNASQTALSSWASQGVNTLLVKVSGSMRDDIGAVREGVWFESRLAPVLGNQLRDFVSVARRFGFRVFAQVPVRVLPWSADRSDWLDLRADLKEGRYVSAERMNLWNPNYREFLTALYTEIADTGVDGMVMFDDWLSEPTDELNDRARQGFSDVFQKALAISDLVPDESGRHQAIYWKWVGWKSRERSLLLKAVMEPVRRNFPDLFWMVVLPIDAVTNPQGALSRYGVDLFETRLAGVDYLGLLLTQADLGEPRESVIGAMNELTGRIRSPSSVVAVILTVDVDSGIPLSQGDANRLSGAIDRVPGIGVLSTATRFRGATFP